MALKIGVAGMLLAIALSVGCNDEQRQQLQNELHATAEARQAAEERIERSKWIITVLSIGMAGCSALLIGTQLGLNARLRREDP